MIEVFIGILAIVEIFNKIGKRAKAGELSNVDVPISDLVGWQQYDIPDTSHLSGVLYQHFVCHILTVRDAAMAKTQIDCRTTEPEHIPRKMKGQTMSNAKPAVGENVGNLSFANVDGSGTIDVGVPKDRWTMLFVYRGKHCPRCKRFLGKLEKALSAWLDVLDVVVVSSDTREKALADKEEFGWTFDLCYGLTEPQMRALGLYVSEPLSEAETTGLFAEPGAFGLRPDGTLMLVDISNGPAARPDLEELLDGMKFNIENDRPVRGTA